MANNGESADNGNSGAEIRNETTPKAREEMNIQAAGKKSRRGRYPDMQSAPRFPIKLPISVKSTAGASATETQNISANGVLFQLDSEMPVGSLVAFTISLPAEVVGAPTDVQLDCRRRVVRSFAEDGRRGGGGVIDEYRVDRH